MKPDAFAKTAIKTANDSFLHLLTLSNQSLQNAQPKLYNALLSTTPINHEALHHPIYNFLMSCNKTISNATFDVDSIHPSLSLKDCSLAIWEYLDQFVQ